MNFLNGILNYSKSEFIKKISSSFIFGILISITVQIVSRMTRINKTGLRKIQANRRRNKLCLKNNKKYSRDEILKIGRDAIRCKITQQILRNPVVGLDGYSYEKEGFNQQDFYDNRILKEFLEKSFEIYHH